MVTKVICVTKDEYDLIETFIVFYGKIFGYNNVIIIDNGSTDQRVLDVYKKYPEVEVRVDAFCFQQVTEVMTKYIIEYKDTCDYMLLLETDEYLYWEGDDELDEDKVRRYIETLPSQARFGKIYQSVVGPDEVDARVKLAQLTQEHRDLDSAIEAMVLSGSPDLLALSRLKKRKLQLKDEITEINNGLLPDIIA